MFRRVFREPRRAARNETRLASRHELIRLTHLPDALGPPCTAVARVGSPPPPPPRPFSVCAYVRTTLVRARLARARTRMRASRRSSVVVIRSGGISDATTIKGGCCVGAVGGRETEESDAGRNFRGNIAPRIGNGKNADVTNAR